MRDIKGYEGLYAVTSCGKVWSYKNEIFLKASPKKNGYLRVTLCKDAKHEEWLIHRLVAFAYLPNPDNLPCVNHIDENKTHNNLQNLEWCNADYNNKYGTRVARTHKAVYCVEINKAFDSVKQAAESLDLRPNQISMVLKGRNKHTHGYHFRYV